MKTVRMKQLIAVVLDRDADSVTKELMRQGVLHFIRVQEVAESWQSKVEPVEPKIQKARVGELRKRIESILVLSGRVSSRKPYMNIDRFKPVDLEQADGYLNRLTDKIGSVREQQKKAQEELLRLEDINRQIELFGDLGTAMKSRSPYSFLVFQTGSAPMRHVDDLNSNLRSYPSVLITLGEEEERSRLLLISMTRDKTQVSQLLARYDWQDIELSDEVRGSGEKVTENLKRQLVTLKEQQQELKNSVEEMVENEAMKLEEMWELIRMNELFSRIQSYFSKTSRTIVFSGWLPAAKQPELEEGVRRVSGQRCYLEWNEPDQEKGAARSRIPVLMKNPRFLSPFQALVQNYAIPEYGSIDPTPIVAVTYLIMFGLMFGDAGQGLVLALIGFIGSRIVGTKNQAGQNLLGLIGWCGLSSIITGLLFGSYFGMQWFKPLWFDFHGIVSGHVGRVGFVKDVYDILVITLYFGVSVIALGLLLNWINLIIKRSWRDLFFDKGGILGGWIYGSGVYIGFYFASHSYRELPDGWLLFWLVGLPALILILKPPIEFGIEARNNPDKRLNIFTVIDFVMQWIVELLEIFSGYLANTLSFMRVAGLGIAHVSLMIAFFEIARLVGGNGTFGVWSVLVLILGNLMIIVLEGLSAGIQALRLNYYEFFTKYFRGGGSVYRPVSLRGDEAVSD